MTDIASTIQETVSQISALPLEQLVIIGIIAIVILWYLFGGKKGASEESSTMPSAGHH